mmetsp:Transcript_30737/g.73292  ORF Transcript_30737/g.73292 Transcript_30737/m.73292 type:complete len:214 (-) Transcript_30737:175-816(-)
MPEAMVALGVTSAVVLPIVTETAELQVLGVQLAALAFRLPALHDKVMDPSKPEFTSLHSEVVVPPWANSDCKYTMLLVVPTVALTPKVVTQFACADTSAEAVVSATAVTSMTSTVAVSASLGTASLAASSGSTGAAISSTTTSAPTAAASSDPLERACKLLLTSVSSDVCAFKASVPVLAASPPDAAAAASSEGVMDTSKAVAVVVAKRRLGV